VTSRRRSSLRNGILTIVMASFAILSLIYGVLLELAIDDYRESRIADHDRYTAIVRRNLTYELDHLMELSTNLSRPRDIVESIERLDNEVLSDWGKAFTKTVGSVVFTDLDGVVIARAPDEFRFADSLSSEIYFEEAGNKGVFLGIAPVDGKDSFVACRPVLKYDDVPVGYLIVSKTITSSFLETLLPQGNMKLTFSDEMDSDLSREVSASLEARRIVEVGGGFFSLDFLPSSEYRELLRLQNSLIFAFLAVTGGTVFFLLYFLRRRFEPYTRMVDALVDYSERKTDLDGLLDAVSKISSGVSDEISYICEALKDMILVLKDKMKNIQSYSTKLEYLANRDSLTGLWNRRKMDQILLSETERSSRYSASLSVVMVDIDHFKSVNDNFGHEVGDTVLSSIAALMKDCTRAGDSVGRWGGEEFLVVLPETDVKGALEYAERMRRAVECNVFEENVRVTSSFGVTQYRIGEPVNEFVARADEALYDAKENGRNRVEMR
jgi:diguanylate cyclase (GGDEF)-like protein